MSDTVVSLSSPRSTFTCDQVANKASHSHFISYITVISWYWEAAKLSDFGGSKRNVISLESCVHYSTWQSPHSSDSVFLYFQTQWKLPTKHMELRYTNTQPHTHTPLQNISTSHISKRRSLQKAPGAKNHLYITKWSSGFQSQKPGWRLVLGGRVPPRSHQATFFTVIFSISFQTNELVMSLDDDDKLILQDSQTLRAAGVGKSLSVPIKHSV